MSDVVDDDEFRARPPMVELPCRGEWCLEIESPVDENGRDVCQLVSVAEHVAVSEPCVVAAKW
jgi:hypothetical protein